MSFKKVKLDDTVNTGDVLLSTKVEMDTFSIDYEIENFRSLAEEIYSPVFVGGFKCQHEWKLQVVPKYTADYLEYISIDLYLVKASGDPKSSAQSTSSSDKEDLVRAKYQISLINSERKVLFANKSVIRDFTPGKGWGCNKFIERYSVLTKGYLTDGHILKIHCDISIQLGLKSGQVNNNFLQINWSPQPPGVQSYTEIMTSFLDFGRFSDFTIHTSNTSFPVSKLLLAAQSDVFNAMFSSGMRESTENFIKIEGHSDNAVKGMLQFIYTGTIELTETNTKELLTISDKYQVRHLKHKCKKFLLENLKVDNAAEILIMAHFHSPSSLKPKVISFINRFKQEVQATEGFKQMEKTHPGIVIDLYKSSN